MSLTEFYCPTHGLVVATNPVSRVECRCGQECAPAGLTPAEQKKDYLEQRKHRSSPAVERARRDRQRKRLTRASVRKESAESPNPLISET